MGLVQEWIIDVGSAIVRFAEWYPSGPGEAGISIVVGVLLGVGIWVVRKGGVFKGKRAEKKEDLLRTAVVDLVLDGDTIRLDSGDVVRIIGIDAPESGPWDKMHDDALATGVDPLCVLRQGQYASMWLRGLVEGRKIWVESDLVNHPDHVDAYGRELAHIWTCDREGKPANLVSVMMAEAGLGLPTRFPHRYEDHVRAARGVALQLGKGRDLGVENYDG